MMHRQDKYVSRMARGRQSGQAIVLMALMMVGLLGMLGLAIDGGDLYFKHRDTQNAVDAAVLAAMYAKCTSYPFFNNSLDPSNPVIVEGREAATSNGYAHDINGVTVNIDPAYLPSGKSAWPSGFIPFVRATIDAPKPSYFIQLVYPDPLRVTSESIAFCQPPLTNVLPRGMAIVSLRPSGCVGGPGGDNPPLRVRGGAEVVVHNGSIFVNSDDPNCAVSVSNNGFLDVSDGLCAVVGNGAGASQDGIDGNLGVNVLCDSITHPDPLDVHPLSTNPLQDIAPPSDICDLPAITLPNNLGVRTLQPGHYPSISVGNGDQVTFAPGIYCIREFRSTGGGPTRPTIEGSGVVIYMPPGHAGWHSTAASSVEMFAPSSSNCVDDPADPLHHTCPWKGLLIWADATAAQYSTPSMAETVHLNGNASANWTGTVYAPRSQCRIEGTGVISMNSQLICWSVDADGGARLDIYYEPPEFLLTAPRITLVQ